VETDINPAGMTDPHNHLDSKWIYRSELNALCTHMYLYVIHTLYSRFY